MTNVRRLRPSGRAALVVLLLGSTLTVMAGAILSPVLHLIRIELDVSGTAAGLVLTAHALAIAVVSPAVGWLIDRFGVRRPLAAGLVLYGLAGGSGLVTSSYPALIAGRVVFGVGAAVVFTGTTVALLALYHGPERDRVMGWRSTAMSLGGVVWPLVGGAVGALAWQGPFGVFLVGVPLGITTLLVLPDERPERLPIDTEHGGAWDLLVRRPVILAYCALFALASVLLYTLVVFLPIRFAEIGVHEPFLVAAGSAGMSVTMGLVGLGYARLRARHSYAALLRSAFGAWVVALVLLGVSAQLAVIVAATVLFGLGMGIAVPALSVLVVESAPARLRGQITSLSATTMFLGQFCSPLLVGPVVDATSTTTGFLAAAGLAGAVLLVLLLTDPPPHPHAEQPAAPVVSTEQQHKSGRTG